MPVTMMRYSGSKIKFITPINKIINKTNHSVYIEPFVGSGIDLWGMRLLGYGWVEGSFNDLI